MSEISDDELRRLLKELKALDDVPEDVAARMDATIDLLAAAEKSKKNSRFTSASWALAAGFTLVFGLGVVLNLETSPISNTPTANPTKSSQNYKDDVLTSSGGDPKIVDEFVSQFSSDIDYSNEITLANLPFKPSTNFGDIARLSPELQTCLVSLGLKESVSLVDLAQYGNLKITAVWSAITSSSWVVSIIDSNCDGIAEVFVNE